MKDRVLVTGGAGFIGSHLTDQLIAQGHPVTVLDDFSSGRRENLELAARRNDVRIIEGSVLDEAALDDALDGCASVYHLAVQCVRTSLGRPIENHEINATGTLKTLEAARRRKVRRFIYCSSSEVYGNCGGERLSEDTTVCAPVTVYGAAKLVGELYAQAYWRTYGLPTIVIRPFNTYGPREHEQGQLAEVIPRFIIRVLNGQPPIIFGNGDNGRDFTYVADTARGIVLAGESDTLIGRVVNIAFGKMITIREVADAVAQACDRPDLVPTYMEPRPGDVLTLQADTRIAREMLGFQAEVIFAQGLEQYVRWFRDRHPDPSALLEDNPRNWTLPSI
ncbi:MAG: NAD-dependent epimerase/dehydratase family protein [Rhizobiaceae bacterium]